MCYILCCSLPCTADLEGSLDSLEALASSEPSKAKVLQYHCIVGLTEAQRGLRLDEEGGREELREGGQGGVEEEVE